jgi:uncharacterized SAM-binding protein YcdF (DUF218 family)
MRLFRSVFLLLLGTLIALLAMFGALCGLIDRQGSRDESQPAAAIVILGAWVQADGRPSEDLFERTSHAVELYRQGLAPRIICTGGFSGDRLSAASVARSVAVAYGVPAQAILLADGSLNTQGDAERAAAVLKSHGWQSALIVSHPLHLYRARLLFEQQGITAYTSPTNTDLTAIPLRWRLGYDIREALFITWTEMEALGLPHDWGESLHRRLYDWSRRSGLPGGIPL